MEDNLRILKPFFRGFPLVLIVVIVSVLSAKKYLNYVTPMYESTAKMKLADANEGVPNSNLFKNFDVFASANKIAGEIEVLKSNLLLQKALKGLNFETEIYRVGDVRSVELFDDSPIKVEGVFNSPKAYDKRYKLKVVSEHYYELNTPGSAGKMIGTFNKPLSFEYGKLYVSLNTELLRNRADAKLIDNYEFEILSEQKLIEKINKNLDIVSTDKDVPVIRINIKSNVPAKAAIFVNKLAETYILDYIENKYKAANTTVVFLDQQIKDAAEKLARSENDIENYRNTENITNIRQETETDLRKISELKIQKTNLKMSLDAIEDLNNYIAKGKDDFLNLAPNFEAFNDLLSTEMMKNIKRLQAEKKDLLLVYTPNDERVQIIDAKIKDLSSYLIESINNTRKNLETKYDLLCRDIETAEEVFANVPEKEKILTILNRDFDLLQSSYNFLNEKKIEAEIAQSAKIAFHKIITFAEVSKTPVSPNRSIIIIVSALLGLFGSISLIYLVHFAKAKVNDAYTIQKTSTIPIALYTPFLKNLKEIEKHFLKEVIQLELKKIISQQTILTVTSHTKNEGRSFHVVNLAKVLALQGRKVLLLDAPGNLNTPFGLRSNTTGVCETSIENISYVSLASPEFRKYSKERMSNHLSEYLKTFDVLVINNEPIAEEQIGLLLMSVATANLFVLDSRQTAAKQIFKIDLLKEEFHTPNIWFVLNKMGHNPNVLTQLYGWIIRMKNKLQSR